MCVFNVVMDNTISIRVHSDDVKKLMGECKELYLNKYPQMKDVPISVRFMFRKVINEILGVDEY